MGRLMPFLHDAASYVSLHCSSYHSAGGKMIVVSNMHTGNIIIMMGNGGCGVEPEVIKWMEKNAILNIKLDLFTHAKNMSKLC